MTGRGSLQRIGACLGALGCALGCSSDPLDGEAGTEPESSERVEVRVPEGARVLIALGDDPTPVDDPQGLDWDLAFDGYEIFTNSGPSGPGAGGAFGPLTPPTYLSDTAPDVPVLAADKPAGAFLDWYDYDGDNHAVLSRFHVYGMREGQRLFKLQILGYYADDGQSASYSLRASELLPDGPGPVLEVGGIDASAGGLAESDAPSGCVDLDSGEISLLTPEQALGSSAWHLCFRRDTVAVNGGLSGPRGVEAVDLDGTATDTESLEEIRTRTASSELGRFEAVERSALEDSELIWEADRVVSAFGDLWLVADADPPEPTDDVWLVVGADGSSHYLLSFIEFSGASERTPGLVRLRRKTVR